LSGGARETLVCSRVKFASVSRRIYMGRQWHVERVKVAASSLITNTV
jgi:hypothetical protein